MLRLIQTHRVPLPNRTLLKCCESLGYNAGIVWSLMLSYCLQDWLLMEEEFVANQERLKPQEERNQADRDKACKLAPFRSHASY